MEYTGSRFQGLYSSGRPDGEGTYIFPNGTRYVGGFKDGMFEGQGTMYIPNCGAYTATWSEGKQVEGEYKFSDGLEYKESDWEYCTLSDRRFKTELEDGIRPAGQSQLTNNRGGDPLLGKNQADSGDGYVDLKKGNGQVCDFKTGEAVRFVEQSEKKWLMEKCRIGPSGSVGRDVGALLDSIFKKNDLDGAGSLPKGDILNYLRESDYQLIQSDISFTDPKTVADLLESANPEEMLSYGDWMEMWSTSS